MHTGNHLASFYEPDHIALQKQFLDYFLMDKLDNGMLDVPRIRLMQRRGRELLARDRSRIPAVRCRGDFSLPLARQHSELQRASFPEETIRICWPRRLRVIHCGLRLP